LLALGGRDGADLAVGRIDQGSLHNSGSSFLVEKRNQRIADG